ncbi:Carbon-nitrogen hydrolase [Gnomoniopsis sp. IMI 355080]|nr:Carbon-nitrogen hydrolase [Gnomoniopsis sp. IMI 355080]
MLPHYSPMSTKVIFFPEASDYIASSPEESLSLAKSETESPFVKGLRAAAREHNLHVNVGIHVPVPVEPSSTPTLSTAATTAAPSGETTKLLNRTIWISPDGQVDPSRSYDKLHLFDYGTLRESRHTQAGTALTPPFTSPVGRIGSLICFDLRFPEPALALAHPPAEKGWQPAQILTYPSAFTVPTGEAHWEPLLRARAIESQCWVVAAAQVAWHTGEQGKDGLVVDPWGRVKVALPGVREVEKEGRKEMVMEAEAVGALGLVDIDLGEWEGVRERMPLVRRT